MNTRSWIAAIAATAVFAQTAGVAQPAAQSSLRPATQTDAILQAMKTEMDRARALKVAGGGADIPYFFEYALDDGHNYSVVATLGGVISERTARQRVPRTVVRVGDYGFDNTNYILSGMNVGARFDSGSLPEDDSIPALRHQFWLSTDRVFKSGREAVGRKRNAMKNMNITEEQLPDFWKAPPVKMVQPPVIPTLDQAAWKARTVKASAAFSAYPKVLGSGIEFESMQTISYLVNSEGTEIRYPDHVYYLRIRASALAPDGSNVRDAAVIHAVDPGGLPSDVELERAAKEVGAHVTALAAAPMGEAYSGPILFEGAAAAQMFADVLGSQLNLTRRPISEPNRPAPFAPSELEGRIGSRVLPSSFSVVDDPTQKDYRGRALIGHYPVDMEGVVPGPVSLIKNGALENMLLTRQPVKGFTASNGRARIPGNFGHKMAGLTNLFIKSTDASSPADLKKRLIAMAQQRNKPYGMIVRKLDFPSTASFDEVRRIAAAMGNQGGQITAGPLLVYRVYADGREELVRGLRFRGLNVKALRDIVAASDELYQFDFLANGAPMSLVGAGAYIWGASVVAPAVLFEDLELERPQLDTPKLPVVPAPELVTSQ